MIQSSHLAPETMNFHVERLLYGQQQTDVPADMASQHLHHSPLAPSLMSTDSVERRSPLPDGMNDEGPYLTIGDHHSRASKLNPNSSSFSPGLWAQTQQLGRFPPPPPLPKQAVSQSNKEESTIYINSIQAYEQNLQPGLLSREKTATPTSEEKHVDASSHSLQDYQMQLMLLEQQNKKRLMMARQEQDQMTTSTAEEEADRLASSGQPPNGEEIPVEIPQTHYTISEDEVAVGMKNRLRAIQPTTDVAQPIADPTTGSTQPTADPTRLLPHGLTQYNIIRKQEAVRKEINQQEALRREANRQKVPIEQHKEVSRGYPQINPGRRVLQTIPENPQIRYPQSQAPVIPYLKPQERIKSPSFTPGGPMSQGPCHEEQSEGPHTSQSRTWPAPPEPEGNRPEPDINETCTPKFPSIMDLVQLSVHGTGNYASTERGTADNSHTNSTPPFDINLLQQIIQRNQELEAEISKLRQEETPVEPEDDSSINVQVFHCLTEDDTDEGLVYLSKPDWEAQGGDAILRGRFPISDPWKYADDKGNIAFIIYKCYNANHQLPAVRKAIANTEPLPEPEPSRQDVLLVSDEMTKAVRAFFAEYPTFYTEFPEVDEMERMYSPYIWWYHCRKVNKTNRLKPRDAELVSTLTNWIEANYAPHYDKIDDQFRRCRVSNTSIEYLIRPGDVLVSKSDGTFSGYLTTTRPRNNRKTEETSTPANEKHKVIYQWSWDIKSRSLAYAGDFHWVVDEARISFDAETEDEEVDIRSLNVVPLRYASDDVRRRLKLRGKTFWKCRDKQLVSYEGHSLNRKHAGQRFMIDFKTYKELHPFNHYLRPFQESTREIYQPADGNEPNTREVYVFPAFTPGFDLRRKKWTDLEVDQIRDVAWNEQAFDNLVADEDMKEMVLALVTNQLTAETSTDLIENKGNGLILLLHGSPGTGKTYTAESVAEIAKKPLYPVTCGDIGTEPEQVEKYLESVFYLGKIWDCVVLLDEAEVFLEQRTLQDLKRNALVSVFLRALEYYEGILILTTNRVGTFDEAFKSRIQLALRYEKLEDYQRKQIWRNFVDRLEKLGEQDRIDFDDLRLHIDELVRYPMNGRQIRNSITTARQLAKFKRKKMTFTHLKRAITIAEKFDKYLAEVREADVDESGEREVNGRYSDEYFARSEQIR
ncbi:hypothetical protein F5Y13DRAFT_163269 [Hypoxylon sp. FL1857]|nr:hypothetical protein F5Y13DRAFT_163269 [Hypoxylon sp. FL1857]